MMPRFKLATRHALHAARSVIDANPASVDFFRLSIRSSWILIFIGQTSVQAPHKEEA